VAVRSAAVTNASEVLKARDFICISSAARGVIEAEALPFGFLTAENAKDSVLLAGRVVILPFPVRVPRLR
jgi:hypothetical protein